MTHPATQKIKDTIDNNSVVLFMKGSKEMPQCGFSNAVVNALSYLNVEFKDIDVLQNEEIREGIKIFSEWPTIPQLYVKGEFIGGCDIVKEMFDTGELSQLFDEKEIPYLKKDYLFNKYSLVILKTSFPRLIIFDCQTLSSGLKL